MIAGDVVLDGEAAEAIGEDIEGEVLDFLEADAALAHIEFLAAFGPGLFEAGTFGGVGVMAHEVEGAVVFLGGEAAVGEGLAGVAVVACGEDAMGDIVADHAVLHAFLELGVEVGEDDLADGFEELAAFRG